MKKNILGFLIIVSFLFIGCTEKQVNSDELLVETTSVKETEEGLNQIDGVINNTERYNDESHKEIAYGQLKFLLDSYHVVSYEYSEEEEKYVCEIDEDRFQTQINFEVKIHSIESQDFTNTKGILSYINGIFQDYESVSIYQNILDDSGITNLFKIKGQSITNYMVGCGNFWFLIETNCDYLETMLFQNSQKTNDTLENFQIECGNHYQAIVTKTTIAEENKIEYNIIQGIGGAHYTARVFDNEGSFEFLLNDAEGNILLRSMMGTYKIGKNKVQMMGAYKSLFGRITS